MAETTRTRHLLRLQLPLFVTLKRVTSLEEIHKNLFEFFHRSVAPLPDETSSSSQTITFQELYKRNVIGKGEEVNTGVGTGKSGKLSFEAIRESLRQLRSSIGNQNMNDRFRGQPDRGNKGLDPMSLTAFKDSLKLRPDDPATPKPFVFGGSDSVLASFFGREIRAKTETESQALKTDSSLLLKTNVGDDKDSPSTPPSTSAFSDVKASLRQSPPSQRIFPSPSRESPSFSSIKPSKVASLEEIRKNLSEFRHRSAAPLLDETSSSSSSSQTISFQVLYKKNVIGKGEEVNIGDGTGKSGKLSFEAIHKSLRQLRFSTGNQNMNDRFRGQPDRGNWGLDPMSLIAFNDSLKLQPDDPAMPKSFVLGGSNLLPTSVFGREIRAKTETESQALKTEFVKIYSDDSNRFLDPIAAYLSNKKSEAQSDVKTKSKPKDSRSFANPAIGSENLMATTDIIVDESGACAWKPKCSLEFDCEQDAYDFYNAYGGREGFRVNDKRDYLIKKLRQDVRTGCQARMSIKLNRHNAKFLVNDFKEEHNHPFVIAECIHMLPSQRKMSSSQVIEVELTEESGIPLRTAYELMGRQSGSRDSLGASESEETSNMADEKAKELLKIIEDMLNLKFHGMVQDNDNHNSPSITCEGNVEAHCLEDLNDVGFGSCDIKGDSFFGQCIVELLDSGRCKDNIFLV
ncbi:hypothetical protein HHK36_005099 [Tetracentron sinense]|uniref:WRKY domain-containing protein n=1 Tax=Tetracentron sinense TaxID=13715 RepID=A0A834ZUV7_TETSI|nr:hypothetical protein HHK36_005099 [Tetracentron sinense]